MSFLFSPIFISQNIDMNYKLPFFFFAILFSQLLKSQTDFVTVWKPSNTSSAISGGTNSTSTQIWFPGKGNNFNVTWEEIGFTSHNGSMTNISSTDKFLIDFGTPLNPIPSEATYKVSVSNGQGTFERIKFPEFAAISPALQIPVIPTFNGDTNKILEVAQWGNIQWLSFEGSFAKCINLDITATDSPNLSMATSTSMMFYECNSLIGNPSFNNWNTSNITNMSHMFASAGNFNQPLGNWDTSKVTNMVWMFHYLSKFNQPLLNWDVSKVTNMDHMFHICTDFNQPLNSWNVSNVTSMRSILENTAAFNQPLSNWNLISVTNAIDMIYLSGIDCDHYNETLIGWASNPSNHSNINLGSVAPLNYSSTAALNAKNILITGKNWSFTGDIYNPECETRLGISENVSKNKIHFYPNPASDYMYIKNLEQEADYIIFDYSGKIVLQGNLNKKEINIKSLPKANYILHIKTKNWIENFKFIKK